jgi:hypothetical protein
VSIHWKALDTPAKIEAVKSIFQPGMSGSQIAACFDGATRNAVIGLFHRYPGNFAGVKLRTRTDVADRVRVAKRRFKSKTAKSIAIPEPAPGEMQLCGRPIDALAKIDCRWPVNDAEVGELHLFCGVPTEATYCSHHASRAYRERS